MAKSTKKPPVTKDQPTKSSKRFLNKILLGIFFPFILFLFLSFSLYLFLQTRFYPAIFLANTNLTALDLNKAQQKLYQNIAKRATPPFTLTYQNQQFSLDLSSVAETTPYSQDLNQAFDYGHTKIYYQPVFLNIDFRSTPKLNKQIEEIASQVEQQAINSQLKIDHDYINVTPSQNGLSIDNDKLNELIDDYLNTGEIKDRTLPTKVKKPKLSYEAALKIKKSLDQIKLSPLTITYKPNTSFEYPKTWTLTLEKVLSFIDVEKTKTSLASVEILDQGYTLVSAKIGEEEYADTEVIFNKVEVTKYLETIAKTIYQEVKEPLLNVDQSGPDGKIRVTEFSPPQEGLKLNIEKSYSLISQALINSNSSPITLPVDTIKPKNRLTNELGIKELIGRGVSNFSGSIENRIFNIKHTASKINGLIIAPGEIFSFVNTVGDISAATGFKPAYVIKSGRTVLDDGGGVCQVSTTVFRAALNSGLPIPKRTAHAYRVSYYEQGFPPGLDATIFHPSVDFQFKNDTSNHILIQAYTIGTTMYVDLYGTSDGRVVNMTKPVITNQTPPPPELRQDDPTLPRGTIKQVDWAASGATVKFSRTVTRNGETLINETYTSNYRPWQAVYLVGTGG